MKVQNKNRCNGGMRVKLGEIRRAAMERGESIERRAQIFNKKKQAVIKTNSTEISKCDVCDE